jgi:hypothetical protein
MRRRSRTSAKFGATGVIVGMGVFACVAAAWSMRLREEPAAADPVVSPADVVALRFPYELEDADQAAAPTANNTEMSEPDETLALFNPYPTYPTPPSDAEGPPPATPPQATVHDEAPPAPSAPVTSGASELAAAGTHRSNVRLGAVLSEAQIASIKRRLRLTPQQQEMWPAVEVALRSLSYPKKSDSARKNGNAIDTNSAEVQQLTSAAYPLVMSFSDDQKRELHEIAHVAGLEQLVPKY